MVELFGHKTLALFDFWSVTHFLTGCGLALPVRALAGRIALGARECLLLVLLLSSLWEIAELAMELGLAGPAVAYWFQGVEHPLNRVVTDQLLLLAGFAVALRHLRVAMPAKALATAWLALHVFALPHSMYLQDRMGLS